MPFDGSTLAAATPVTFTAGLFSDTFQVGGSDVDMIRIDLTAGRHYSLDVDGGLDFALRVFDDFGTEVFLNDDGARSTDDVVNSLSPFADFAPNYTGTYYIAVSPYYLRDYDPATLSGRISPENPLGVSTGTLTITDGGTNSFPSNGAINGITTESGADKTDAQSDRGPQRLVYSGAVDNTTDVDMARFDLAKGTVAVVDVNGETAGVPNGTVLRIFDDTGIIIGFDDDSGFGDDPELIFVAPNFDDYYIAISGEGNSSYNGFDGTGTVAGTIGSYEVIIHLNPTLIGSSSVNSFIGTEGRDYIVSLAGNDTVNGGDGADTLSGGDDVDLITGGNGRDVIYGDSGSDSLDGGNNSDVLSGGFGLDTLLGGNGDDILQGGLGNDSLNGGGNNDSLRGDDGDDVLLGGAGVDVLFGGVGLDTLNGGAGDDRQAGDAGNDRLDGFGGNDSLSGDDGDDLITGGTGFDTLLGGIGIDKLFGGNDADLIEGGAGDDLLSGGTEADTFRFVATSGNGIDTITDFLLATDLIDLSAIFAATASVVTAGNLGFFIQVTAFGDGSESLLSVDADGSIGGLSFSAVAVVNDVTAGQLFNIANFIV